MIADADDEPITLRSERGLGYGLRENVRSVAWQIVSPVSAERPKRADAFAWCVIGLAIGFLIGALSFGCTPKVEPKAPVNPVCTPDKYEGKCV